MKNNSGSRYLGSIRFYKNMILLFILLAIGLGIFFSLYYRERYLDALTVDTDKQQVSAAQVDIDAEGSDYTTLYPEFYAPEAYQANQRDSFAAYLTFDEGPSEVTSQILEKLAAADVKGTFFVTRATDPQWLKAITDGGHTIGMLSWSMDYLSIYSSVADYLADMSQLFTYIQETTGQTPTVFRFPGGSINSYNTGIYRELLAEMVRRGFVPYDWNVSVQDHGPNSLSADVLLENLRIGISGKDRCIILLHDSEGRGTTVEALPSMIALLQEQGFHLDPLTPSVKPVLFAYQ